MLSLHRESTDSLSDVLPMQLSSQFHLFIIVLFVLYSYLFSPLPYTVFFKHTGVNNVVM